MHGREGGLAVVVGGGEKSFCRLTMRARWSAISHIECCKGTTLGPGAAAGMYAGDVTVLIMKVVCVRACTYYLCSVYSHAFVTQRDVTCVCKTRRRQFCSHFHFT